MNLDGSLSSPLTIYKTRGRMYGQRIAPLIALVFYSPFKLKKIGVYEARLGLSGRSKRM